MKISNVVTDREKVTIKALSDEQLFDILSKDDLPL